VTFYCIAVYQQNANVEFHKVV